MSRIRSLIVANSLLAMLIAFPGCGGQDGPEKAPVSGEVKLQGAPLPEAVVMIVPSDGPVAAATTDGEGKFDIPNGVVVGPVKVTVEAIVGSEEPDVPQYDETDPASMANAMKAYEQNKDKQQGPKSLIPKKYADLKQTPLSYEVINGEDNHFVIEIEK